jgi:hypothetical protein
MKKLTLSKDTLMRLDSGQAQRIAVGTGSANGFCESVNVPCPLDTHAYSCEPMICPAGTNACGTGSCGCSNTCNGTCGTCNSWDAPCEVV